MPLYPENQRWGTGMDGNQILLIKKAGFIEFFLFACDAAILQGWGKLIEAPLWRWLNC